MKSETEFVPGLIRWPWWKRALKPVCDAFELEDHEYIKFECCRFPFTFWITVLEPRYRTRWRKYLYWRLRLQIFSLIRQRVWATCTVCGRGFTFHELLARDGSLQFYLSGSISHTHHTEEENAAFNKMIAEWGRGGIISCGGVS